METPDTKFHGNPPGRSLAEASRLCEHALLRTAKTLGSCVVFPVHAAAAAVVPAAACTVKLTSRHSVVMSEWMSCNWWSEYCPLHRCACLKPRSCDFYMWDASVSMRCTSIQQNSWRDTNNYLRVTVFIKFHSQLLVPAFVKPYSGCAQLYRTYEICA